MKKVISLLLCAVMLFGMIPSVGAQTESNIATLDTQENEISVSGTNSVGSLLSEEINQAQQESELAELEYSGGYAVVGLSFENNIATVEYSSLEEANLIVALYSEDGLKLLNSGNAVVSADETVAEVTIEGEMPQYFLASAYLVDIYDFSPLCPAYDTPMYTKEMQDLLASTVEDYDQEKVLNLDDSSDTNFAVYTDTVVVIDGGNNINTVVTTDYEKNTYVIANVDEQITSLAAGAIIAYPWAEGEVLIIKISTISIDGTTATITGAEMEIEDVFAYMKLETDGGMETAEIDESTCEEGVTYEGVIEETAPATRGSWEGGADVKKSFSFKLEKKFKDANEPEEVTVSGGLTLSVKASLSFYISLSKQFIETEVKPEIGFDIAISAKLPVKEISLPGANIPTPVPGLVFDFQPKVVLEVESKVQYKASLALTLGFSYDSKKGFHDSNMKPEVESKLSVEGKVFLGAKMKFSVAIVDDAITSLGFSTKCGIQVTGKLKDQRYEPAPGKNDLEIHSCTKCLDMSFDYVQDFSVEAKFFKFIKAEKKFLTVTFHLFKFYISFDPINANSDFGSCPYKAYRMIFKVTDLDGRVVQNVLISDENGEEWGKTNENGVLAKYLRPGKYSIIVDSDTVSSERTFTVSKAGSLNIVIGDTASSPGIPSAGVLGNIDTQVITDEVVQKAVEVTSLEAGVPYKFGLDHTSNDELYYFTGTMDSYYGASSTICDNAVDVFLVETTGGYYLSFINNSGALKYINVVTSGKYINFSIAAEPKSIYVWDDTYNTLLTELNGTTYFIGTYSYYTNFSISSYNQISHSIPARFYTIQYGKPDESDTPASANSCGKNVTWSLNDNGVLTISGTGEMKDYPHQGVPWYDSIHNIKKVVIEEGVTKIGDSAFQHCTNMQSVEIADTVTKIGRFAFDSCRSLQSVTIPEGVTEIRNHTFWSCYSLTTITIPDSVTSIGWRAFRYCNALTSVLVGKGVNSIDEQAFDGCTSLKAITYRGDAPSYTGAVFGSVTATAYYPVGNTTWTSDVLQGYGGNITWVSYSPTKSASTGDTVAEVVAENEIVISADDSSTTDAVRERHSVRGVYGGEYSTEAKESYLLKTASFSDLVPGQEYLLLAMVTISSDNPLDASNLLFVDQAVALEDGTLVFRYVQREDTAISYVMACGASNKNLNDAIITFPPMCEDTESQAVNPLVVYDGKTLREGIDYTVVGTTDFTEEGTYTCYIRGIYNYTGLVPCTYTVLDKAVVTAWNLTLGNQISVNFYMDIEDAVKETAAVNITLAEKTVSYPVADAVVDEATGQYVFTVGLNAAQMTENVTVELVNNGQVFGSKCYSVRQYADYVLSDENGIPENIKALVREMLAYGGASQTYFAYKLVNLADDGITDATVVEVPESAEELTVSDGIGGVDFYGASLVYRDRIAVRYYFTGDVTGCTFAANGNTYTPVAKDGMYYVEIADILPQELDRQITLKVTDAEGNQLSVTYGPMNYIVRMNEKGSESLKALIKALYNYHLAAKAYSEAA